MVGKGGLEVSQAVKGGGVGGQSRGGSGRWIRLIGKKGLENTGGMGGSQVVTGGGGLWWKCS